MRKEKVTMYVLIYQMCFTISSVAFIITFTLVFTIMNYFIHSTKELALNQPADKAPLSFTICFDQFRAT